MSTTKTAGEKRRMVLKEIKLKGLPQEQVAKIIPPHTFLLGYRGSISHGTYVPNSNPNSIDDKDIMGVAFGPFTDYVGLLPHKGMVVKPLTSVEAMVETSDKKIMWDSVVYEVRKFFHLLLKQNPNVLALLWLEDNLYIHRTEAADKLIANKDIFASKICYDSFIGYAKGQLHRMENFKFDGYMGAKRKALVDKMGFDCKNGGHLIRLLQMGIEYLTDGQLRVLRPNATELIDIKLGKWSLERVKKESNRLFVLAEEAFVRSPLPPKPNYEKANALLEEILWDHLNSVR